MNQCEIGVNYDKLFLRDLKGKHIAPNAKFMKTA